MATAFEIASWEELRPVRKMYLFHFSPVIWSATAGSTIRIFLFSSATGRSASAAADHVRPALVVLGDDNDLAAVERHGALGGIFQSHAQTGFGLLGIGLERPGLAI